jgi:hypothetical protein
LSEEFWLTLWKSLGMNSSRILAGFSEKFLNPD